MRFFQTAGSRVLVLAALALGAATLVACNQRGDATTTAPARAALSWDATRSHLFELELLTTSELTGAPAAATLLLKSGVELDWRSVANGQQARVVLLHPLLTDASGKPSDEAEPLARALAAPFAVELSHGLIKAYLEPQDSPQVAGFRRQIAAVFQWAEHAPASTWKAVEWDATGLGKVEYRATSGAASTWDFTKLGYDRVVFAEHHAAQALDTKQVAPKVEKSSGRLETDASGIVRVTREEQISVPLSASASLVTQVKLSLKRTGFAPAISARAWNDALAALQRAEVGSPPPRLDRKLEDQARIGSHTFGEVTGALTQLESKPDGARPSVAESAPLFHALVGIFRQQPETIEAAVQQVRSRARISDTLLDALAMASTEPALQSLGRLAFDTTVPQATRLRAAGSMIRAQDPSPGAFELAVKMIDEPLLHEQGLYGVGSFVRQLREKGNTALAAAGSQVLLRKLKQASVSGDLSTVLLAISNSGSAELFQPVLSYQTHADAPVRHAALQAVRLMPQPEAEGRLREALSRTDRSDVVEALHALGRRPNATRESVDKVETLAKNDPSADVRREAALVLSLWSQLWPSLVPVLAALHENDPDQRVREVAKPVLVQ